MNNVKWAKRYKCDFNDTVSFIEDHSIQNEY